MGTGIRPDTPDWKGMVSTCLLVVAWVYANISSLKWIVHSFRQASHLNLMLVGLVVTVLLVQVVRQRRRLVISTTLILRPYPLLLMLGSAVSAIALKWLVDIEQIAVILFALGTYGLCGLFLTPSVWRKGLPIAVLVACILPFSTQFGTGLGFPVRVLTAHVVEQLLSAWDVAAISSADIIVLENGIAHVDLPCSGLKSLWTGTLFLLAATWIEGRQLSARWWLVCFSNLFFLSSANTVRVLLLVLITYVLKQTTYAQILHVPLGLMGLGCACALTWAMLQSVPRHKPQTQTENELKNPFSNKPKNLKAQALLLGIVIVLALSLPRPTQVERSAIASMHWPAQMVSELLPLTEAEQTLFNNQPTVPEKLRFVLGELSGSILLVSSTSWEAYHPPELCLVGNGLKVDRMERKWLTKNVLARWLSLQDGKLSATYWFQSPQHTTDDFLSRIWDYIAHRQKTWVMVSVLFNTSYSPDNPEIRAFATTIHNVIDHSLNGV